MAGKYIHHFKNKKDRIEYWHKLYQDFFDSGLTKVRLCQQNNISKSAFYKWIQYFKQKTRK